MATTNSTRAIRYEDNTRYQPKRIVIANSVIGTSAGSFLSTIMDTRRYTQARVSALAKALGAATTVTVEVVTGPTSSAAAITQNCLSSSGSTQMSIATTTGVRRVFRGLSRWSRLAYYVNGTNASTDLSIDVELL